MTVRISSFQSSPATTFELHADVVETDPDYGSNGRWRVRFYLDCYNGPGGSTGSFSSDPGVQIGRYGNSNSEFGRHSGTPFLPAGVPNGERRWREGPFYEYVNANSDGFYSGGSSSLPLRMDLDYGSADVSPTSSFVMGRIEREPGKTPTPTFSNISDTGVTVSWGAAPRGNADTTNYQIQYSPSPSFNPVSTANNGTSRTHTSTSRTPGTQTYVRVRAGNAFGYGDWSNTASFLTAPEKAPTPSLSSVTSTGLTASWGAVDSATSYTVQWSSNPSFSGAPSADTSSTSRAISGLTPGTIYYVRVRANNGSGPGAWSNAASQRTNPGTPGTPTFSAITPTSVTVAWATPSGATSAITGYTYQISTNSSFSAIVATIDTGVVNSDNTANDLTLNPGTVYYVRVRAKIGSQVGSWSNTGTFQTLVSTPPSLVVTASPAGTQATVVLSPPSGISNVDSYTMERRVKGTTSPVVTSTTTSNSIVATGLTPGVTYEYRAFATVGAYDSPWSAWVERRQPQPSTNPGDYFDGDSEDTENEVFEWTGTPNNSTSQVVGEGALGWYANPSVAGGACVVTRVVGGYVGDYAARMFVQVAPSAAGMELGQSPDVQYGSPVVPGATYYGSMYVNPSKSQRITTMIIWRREDNSVISIDQNQGQVCAPGEWTRVIASGAAPSDAVRASVRVVDTEGAGWSLWEAGDTLLADAAMLTLSDLFPYFDGDTEDSTDYTYEWNGTAHNSDSQRTIVTIPGVPVIRDPDCAPLPSAPRPPTINSDCIVETGTWRRYWSMIPADEVSDTLYTIPAVIVNTLSVALRQLRVRFYQAPQGVDDPNAIDASNWDSEMVVSYVPANSTLILDSVEQEATISVAGSEPAQAGHFLYGSGGAPVVWPRLHCGVNYFVSFETPTSVPVGNQTFGVVLTQQY